MTADDCAADHWRRRGGNADRCQQQPLTPAPSSFFPGSDTRGVLRTPQKPLQRPRVCARVHLPLFDTLSLSFFYQHKKLTELKTKTATMFRKTLIALALAGSFFGAQGASLFENGRLAVQTNNNNTPKPTKPTKPTKDARSKARKGCVVCAFGVKVK